MSNITISDFSNGHESKPLTILGKRKDLNIYDTQVFKGDEITGSGFVDGFTSDEDENTSFSYTITMESATVYLLGEEFESSDPLKVYLFGMDSLETLTEREIFSIIATTV